MTTGERTRGQVQAPDQLGLSGVVERIVYRARDTGFTVVRFRTDGEEEPVTVVGIFPSLEKGQALRLVGAWRDHARFGLQFQVSSYEEVHPTTLLGIEKYLGSGLIKGIGPATAHCIVAYFGLETLDIIEHQSERLFEVPGIASKRVEMIRAAWETQRAMRDVMVFLQGHGVSPSLAFKIYKQYGPASISTVGRNPYQLALDIDGIGFVTADTIARHLGIAPDAEFRCRAGIMHALRLATEQGHCFLPQAELVERAARLLELPGVSFGPQGIADLVASLGREGVLVVEGGRGEFLGQVVCTTPAFARTESALAACFLRLLSRRAPVDLPAVRHWVTDYLVRTGSALSDQQRLAVELAACHRVLVVTGGPGCGKTFVTRAIVDLWAAMGKSVALAAPTGRAAQRLGEMALREAKTVHRLLAFDPRAVEFRYNEDNPLPVDAVVVDEASMLDVFLAHALVSALAPGTHLLVVGDADQLPSVGPGNVLRDLILCGRVPVVRLTEVFRQARASHIIANAHLINAGRFPQLAPLAFPVQSDCLWLEAEEPEQGVEEIRRLAGAVIPALGFDPTREVQVLSPSTQREVGTHHLNVVLQEVLNPQGAGKPELSQLGPVMRVGDRVMQTVNDYEREVFNGDIGYLVAVDAEEQRVTVRFAGREVVYDDADLGNLSLAWAVTVHKAQGSEYPVVVIPLFLQHYVLLSRSLLYTGFTRAKQLVILVGSAKAVQLAVSREHGRRFTSLAERLVEGVC